MTKNMSESLRKKSALGALWSFIDIFSRQILTFVIELILARILFPKDYGLIAVLSIFIRLSNVLIECGFSNALIRKTNRTQRDYSTAFYLNIAIGIITYTILFCISPYVSVFFDNEILTTLLRFIGLNVIFNSLSIVQNAILTANLRIKIQTTISIAAQIPMGILAIYLAYQGLGVWALAIQQVGASFIRTLLLWIAAKWRPSLEFNKDSYTYLFNFGSKVVGANLLGTIFSEAYSFIIGRYIGKSDLGFYSKGRTLAEQPKNILTGVIQKITIPTLSEYQTDNTKLRDAYRKYIELVSFVMFPTMYLFIIIAEPLITLLWTSKWASTIFLFQCLCFGYAWEPIGSLNMSLLQVVGKTGFLLKLEFIKKPLLLLILIFSMQWGIRGIVIGQACYSILGTLINMQITKIILNYNYSTQLLDITKYILCSIPPLILGYYTILNIEHQILQIIGGICIFAISYLIINISLNLPALNYLITLVKKK